MLDHYCSRCALSISLAAALLTACGSSSVSGVPANSAYRSKSSSSGSKTFDYTGKKQSFTVPAGVTQLAVVVRGAVGGNVCCPSPSFGPPAFGGRVDATITVQPGQKLYVFVGGRGQGSTGGFNGGGSGGASFNGRSSGWGGGGASDIRASGDTLPDRIVVAAGGAGAGGQILYTYGYGGDGGGFRGRAGTGGTGCENAGGGGGGGTQHKGGAGGPGGKGATPGANGKRGADGTWGNGGNGGDGANASVSEATGGGGGGGGGYHGGGGGGGGAATYAPGCGNYYDGYGGGAGGGSSYIEPGATHRRIWTGYKRARADGLVVISWS